MSSERLEEIFRILGTEKTQNAKLILAHIGSQKFIDLCDSIDLDTLARDDSHLSFQESHYIFNPYLGDSIFIRPFQLYDKHGKALESFSIFTEATIYFIAKRKKLRFILNETRLEEDCLRFSISTANKKITHKISLTHLILGEESKNQKISIVPVLNLFDFQELQIQKDFPISGISIDESKSDESSLLLTLYPSYGEPLEIFIYPHLLMDLSQIYTDDFSEVLYIGQSQKMRQRTISHEKIQQALAELEDKEDVYLYLFNIKVNRTLWNSDRSLYDSEDLAIITDEGRINLTEMALINYFKPKYNSNFVNSKISANKQVDELLKSNNYTRLNAEISFDSPFWRFGSSVVKPKQHHIIVYKLDTAG